MNSFRYGLLEEIKFWRNMLLDSDLPQASPEYQKMQCALELAQAKLADLREEAGAQHRFLSSTATQH